MQTKQKFDDAIKRHGHMSGDIEALAAVVARKLAAGHPLSRFNCGSLVLRLALDGDFETLRWLDVAGGSFGAVKLEVRNERFSAAELPNRAFASVVQRLCTRQRMMAQQNLIAANDYEHWLDDDLNVALPGFIGRSDGRTQPLNASAVAASTGSPPCGTFWYNVVLTAVSKELFVAGCDVAVVAAQLYSVARRMLSAGVQPDTATYVLADKAAEQANAECSDKDDVDSAFLLSPSWLHRLVSDFVSESAATVSNGSVAAAAAAPTVQRRFAVTAFDIGDTDDADDVTSFVNGSGKWSDVVRQLKTLNSKGRRGAAAELFHTVLAGKKRFKSFESFVAFGVMMEYSRSYAEARYYYELLKSQQSHAVASKTVFARMLSATRFEDNRHCEVYTDDDGAGGDVTLSSLLPPCADAAAAEAARIDPTRGDANVWFRLALPPSMQHANNDTTNHFGHLLLAALATPHAGSAAQCIDAYATMRRDGLNVDDIVSHNTILSAIKQSVPASEAWFNCHIDGKLEPDNITWVSLLGTACKCNDATAVGKWTARKRKAAAAARAHRAGLQTHRGSSTIGSGPCVTTPTTAAMAAATTTMPMAMTTAPVVLAILDGWGHRSGSDANAISQAHTPVIDALWAQCPRTTIEASGAAVGLPPGQMGVRNASARVKQFRIAFRHAHTHTHLIFFSFMLPMTLQNSEVGHLTIGAGRIIQQELVRIGTAVADGDLATNAALTGLAARVEQRGTLMRCRTVFCFIVELILFCFDVGRLSPICTQSPHHLIITPTHSVDAALDRSRFRRRRAQSRRPREGAAP
jgi:hypothetical protein